MKKFVYLFLALLLCFLVGCKTKEDNTKLEKLVVIDNLPSEVEIGESFSLDVRFVFKKGSSSYEGEYTYKVNISDRTIVSYEGGKIYALKDGIVDINIIASEDEDFDYTFTLIVRREIQEVKEVELLENVRTLDVGDRIKYSVSFKSTKGAKNWINEYSPYFVSSDNNIAYFENGVLIAKSSGSVDITIYAIEDKDFSLTFSVTVNNVNNSNLKLEVKANLTAGELASVKVTGLDNYTVESTNTNSLIVSDSTILAIREGSSTINIVKDGSVVLNKEIKVNKYVASSASSSDLAFVNNILKDMTIEQKVGQMFIGSSSGTKITSSAIEAITSYHLGNFVYMGNNVTSPSDAYKLSTDLQNKFLEANNNIPAFISTDQETGTVNRMNYGATRFLSNMAVCATNDPYNSFLIGSAVGEELKNYGINFDLCPVLDVNNNPLNPIINCRSYSDDPVNVARFGTMMMAGLKSQNVMSCSKHFPGHGNTSTDTHLSLPTITASLDDLYKVELAPFISAIYYGIDAIMTTHIIFSSIDTNYPATLSQDVLTGLLRNSLGYDGLIVTDGMEMSAITKNYGKEEAAVLAVIAGADMVCYTSVSDPMICIPAVLNAVKDGRISEARIDDSVRRILLKKVKYGLFEECKPTSGVTLYDTTSHEELNLDIARQAVTVYKGKMNGLDKTKSTIIMSSTSSFDLGYSGNENSFGYVCSKYLKENGMKTCDYDVISSISSKNIDSYIEKALNYDQIVIAIDTANSNQISFVNKLASKRNDIIVVALKLPYDLNSYEGVNTFITIYDRTPVMIQALKELFNGEYEATGKCSVKLNK